jgi:hypothetical protein
MSSKERNVEFVLNDAASFAASPSTITLWARDNFLTQGLVAMSVAYYELNKTTK